MGSRSKPKAKIAAGRRRAKRRPPTFYERHRAWIWLAGLVLVGAGALLIANLGGGTRPASGEPIVGGDLHSLVVDPSDPSRIYVGGHQAVAVSTDGGKSWHQVDSLEDADAMGWAFMKGEVFVGGHPGIHVSGDGGKAFERRNQGLPSTDVHALGAGADFLVAASPQAGIFTSDDGRSWRVISPRAGRSFMGHILVDPRDPQYMVVPDMAGGAVASRDGGRTWRSLGGVEGAMWVSWDPGDTNHLIASSTLGAVESFDGGQTWRQMNVPEGTWMVEMSPADPKVLFAAVHEDPRAVVWRSDDGGASWRRP